MITLLVGATRLLGADICHRLVGAGMRVRAMVRTTADPAKRAALEALGVEVVPGDLKETESLARACHGVGAVISTASSTLSRQAGDSIETVDHQGQLALVEAARRAGVERFVFVSFRGHPAIQFPLARAKRAVEDAVKASGMRYTILQASYFIEVWLTPALGFDAANGKVRFYGDGSQPVSHGATIVDTTGVMAASSPIVLVHGAFQSAAPPDLRGCAGAGTRPGGDGHPARADPARVPATGPGRRRLAHAAR